MLIYERAIHDPVSPGPGSPPGMTTSKSSKSSSFSSLDSDDGSVLADVNHFEDIGLHDNTLQDPRNLSDQFFKSPPNPYSPSFSSDFRATSKKPASASTPRLQYSRDSSRSRPKREFTPAPKSRPTFPSLQNQIRSVNGRVASLGLLPDPHASPLPIRSLGVRHAQTFAGRHRSPSPSFSLSPRDPNLQMKPRRSSWQSNRERKTAMELELECDEEDGDDIPEGLVLDNVPISPRPPMERSKSQPSSKAPSPERPVKDRIRSVGNGTPPVAIAHGSLRSPTWKSDSAINSAASSRATSPVMSRAKSWNAALSELNAEAKALTEKLEEHADEVDHKSQRSSTGSMPTVRRSSDYYDTKPRVKSAIAELPPLRRTNIMIDPLPISKEKEAVLSRTRPSWLPPKNPAEERRHLKEYQKMMAQSAEAERRRETAKRVRSECRDTAADSLMQIWEQDILPRWNDAIRERRTRDLWWRGVAPRSRGAVWNRAVGNELGLTKTSFTAALGRARDIQAKAKTGHESVEDSRATAWFEAIVKDVGKNTWPDLRIFQSGGPLHQGLVDILSAYAMYRSDIGYVPGCNTIAALLLINLPTPTDAFIALANILNRSLPLSFFASDAGAKSTAYNLLLQTLSRKYPSLHDHLVQLPDHDPELYLGDIFSSLFTNYLALDQAARLWDVYVFEGDNVLIRACVALLAQKEMSLMGTKTIEDVNTILRHSTEGAKGPQVTEGHGEEDRWMRAVKEAGKA
ncbi:rab-GTPase-TBC domain-containing protein [Lasiosphaeria miniovina]|uniref:Rab-GTPase-TBC domain-containing protein n=1 Tax=Lasiosphaeria miniovina TaxID=1954250 RepID=A0AA40DQY2_9PEZI|nr:rab-GTPase-TBC domain-containing protein [Lasiosphaeria miniovina]KAK0712879.1 rab-GTPase-TBC domain-containing protein [Lasiosphaeria miniovina]